MRETPAGKRFLKSRWIVPVTAPPVENGILVLEGDRVVELRQAAADDDRQLRAPDSLFVDYGNAVIMPGLINLHTHIEYTSAKGFDTHSHLFSWIPKLMGLVRQWQPDDFLNSARMGAREILRSGTTTVVDSSYTGQAALALAEAGLRAVVGLELFGVNPAKAGESWTIWLSKFQTLRQRIEEGAESDSELRAARSALNSGLIKLSVAPHAPYTVSPLLMNMAARWAIEQGLPYMIHVAESPEEMRWTCAGSEVVDGFLLGLHGIVQAHELASVPWRKTGKTPVQLMHEHGVLGAGLVAAHCTQLTDADIGLLAQTGAGVAHCPRSNSRLGNGIARLPSLLEASAVTGFGTDSAASTENLCLLSEAQFAWKLQRAVDPGFDLHAERAVRMLTIDAARAIGMSDCIGSLESGKFADIAVFNLDNCGDYLAQSPYDALLYGTPELVSLLVGGKQVFDASVLTNAQ